MTDQRNFPRLNESWHFTYRILSKGKDSKEALQQVTTNMSGGGIRFTSEEELYPETQLAIEMNSKELPSPIIALGSVVWCHPLEENYEVGAEFSWIAWRDNNAQQSIANFVSSALEAKDREE
jgi:hypothetical protein